MEDIKNLGTVNEKELEKIADDYKDVVGGATPAIVSAITALTLWVCPSGSCTSTGSCK